MTTGLLLLHAFPLDEDMWDPQVAALGPNMPVVTVGLPGFGETPMAEPEGWMDTAADVAEASLRGTGIDRVVVCGASLGGYVAFALWRRHSERVSGLVLANTRAEPDDDEARDRRRALAERLRAEGHDFLVESPPPLLSEHAPAEAWERVRTLIRRQEPEAIARAALAMGARPDATPLLQKIDVPTMVITSSGDTLIPPDVTSAMGGQIRDAEVVVIEGAGHLPSIERPDEFNRLLVQHAQRCGVDTGIASESGHDG